MSKLPKQNGVMVAGGQRCYFSEDEIFPLQTINMKGVDYNVPRNATLVVQEIYGPQWNIPLKSAHASSYTGATNYTSTCTKKF